MGVCNLSPQRLPSGCVLVPEFFEVSAGTVLKLLSHTHCSVTLIAASLSCVLPEVLAGLKVFLEIPDLSFQAAGNLTLSA